MSVTGAERKWTYEEYARLPDDGNRYEVIDGEVCVTPAAGTRHQRVVRMLLVPLDSYVSQHRLGEIFSDIDLLFQDGEFFRPDLLFVPREAASGLKERGLYAMPGLVIEVLSPGSQRHDRVTKPARYREFGVPEYWVVDPVGRTIERHSQSRAATPEVVRDTLVWQPNADAAPLELDVQRLFHAE
ncbi:MAG TPA: Uma2 family endonuclease [Longimicrobiales bacterium]|nr:Uma2 family endonuclease [Longimicrobiales bacterium]